MKPPPAVVPLPPNESRPRPRVISAVGALPNVFWALVITWSLAARLMAQTPAPSVTLDQEKGDDSPTASSVAAVVPAPPLLLQVGSNVVFIGYTVGQDGTNVVVEYSPDLRVWGERFPLITEAIPPPPPIEFITRLKTASGENIRVAPLEAGTPGAGFFRTKAKTGTNTEPAAADTVEPSRLEKP